MPGSSRELVEERTEFTALFANPDGSKTVRSSTSPLHYRAGQAPWEQIDTAVVADGAAPGVLKTKANSWTARFRPLPAGVEFDTPEGRLSFSPLGAAAVAPQLGGDPSVVVYPEAWPGVDLRYEVTPTEVKEDLILKRRPATAMFEFSTGGTEFDTTPEGGLVPKGRDPKKGRLAPPEVTDMKGTELTAAKPTMRTVIDGGGKIQLKIDEKFLAETPDSAFPIILDPTVQLGSGNMQNHKRYPNGAVASCTSACQLRVGNTVEPWNGALTDAYWRSVGFFDYSAAFGASVSDVSLDLARSPGDGTAEAHANNVKVFLPNAYSWPGAVGGGVLLAQGTVGENTGSQPIRGAAMTNQIAAWARDRVWGGALGFTGLEQPGLYTYKKFSVFNLNVTYSATPPGTPTSLSAAAQRDGSVVLSYPAASPDGGAGTVRYEVKAFTSAGQWGGTFHTTSTAPITWNGLTDGTTYWFTVQAFNTVGGSGVRTSPKVLATRYAAAPPNVKVWPGNATAWVTWEAADARGGPPITGYEVYLCKVDGSGCYGPTTVANVFGRAKVTPPGIINGVPYLAVVRALTARGIGDNGLSQNVTLSASAAPFPVQYVSASAGSGTRTWISWTPPEANGTGPLTKYIIWRLVNGVHTQYWDNIPATAPAGGTIGTFEATNLTDTRASTYEVYPVNANGHVGAPGPGPATWAVTPAANAAPYTPQRPEGSDDVVNRPSLQAADGQVLVRWSPPAPNGATSSCGAPTKYAAYLLDGVGVPWLSQVVPGTSSGAVFTTTPAGAGQPGIINGHTYIGVVYALNDSGSCANNGWSGPSYTDYGTPMSGLGDLVTPTQVAASRGDQKATVTWHKPFYGIDGLTTYTITATPDPANNPSPPIVPTTITTEPMSGGSTLTHDIGGLRNGTTYTITVRANLLFLFANPDSAPSNPVTPAGVPFAPVITGAAAGNQSATVSWQPPPARDGIPGDNGAAITTYTVVPTPACPDCTGTTTTDATSTTVTGLTNGTNYTFNVFATNIIGPGAASADSEPVMPAGKPFRPTGASASWAGTDAANVTWQAPQASGIPGDNGAPIVSYTVVPTPACPTCQGTTTPGATSTTVTGLQPETTYSFTVAAANTHGTSDASPSSNQIIPPLAAVDPRGGSIDVPLEHSLASADGLQPPVTPTPLAPQVRPASELVDAAAANAKGILGRAGRLTASGDPDLAAGNLQPQVDSAEFFDPTRATLEQLTEALTGGTLPSALPVDPLALLEELPDGLLPSLTYRVCSESATKAASCSATLPLAVPVLVDATGDGTSDVLVDVLPSVSTADVVARVREILDLQALLDGGNDVQAELDEKTAALLGIVNVGLALLSVRLPTSETSGGPLAAHVWAVYELPGDKRLSVGFDGFRRGDTLPQNARGTFTFNPGSATQGIFDVRGAMVQDGAGSELALTLGIASVIDGHPVDPTVASAQFSPVPTAFDARAVVDVGGERATVDATTNIPTRLDAIVLTNRLPASGGFDRFMQLLVDQFPTTVGATVSRRAADGRTTLDYTASSPVANIGVADLEYGGTTLNRAITASASNLPARFSTSLTTVPDGITLDYTAASRISALDFGFYDQALTTVGTASARDLPTALNLAADLPARRVTSEAAEGVGSLAGVFSRNGAPFAPLDGDHASLITVGDGLGLSGKVTGLRKIDLIADAHPRLAATFEPGGQPFTAAGSIDGVDLARIDVSNLPATLSVDLDPAARTVAYRGTAPIAKIRGAYTRTTTGPTLVLGLEEVPTSVDASYGLGDQPRAHVDSSSPIRRVELFASPDPIQTLDRESASFLSLAATDVPTTVDLKVDIPTRHAEGRFSAPVGTVTAVARSPFAGRIFHAAAKLTGIPAQFNADFAEGTYRFEGSGPITSAALAVTNHPNAKAPIGQHIAAHYHQASGDFDASASIRNLSLAEYAKTATDQTFTVNADAAGQPVFIDADVVLTAGGVADTRLAALGRVDGLPNVIRAGLVNGTLSYSADRPTGLKAEVHVGKVDALDGLAAPLLDNGVALAAKGCDSGPGCATDGTPLCTIFSRCLGLVGTVNLSGLPTTVALDPAARTVRVAGYQPPATVPLQAYLDLDGLIGSTPRLQALATLAGLPSPLDLTIGPFSFDSDSSTELNVGYQASAPLGSLQVQAAAKTTAYGDVRGRVNLSPLPMTLNATAEFGSVTRLAVNASAPLDVLNAQVTGLYQGAPASAQADLRQIPARLSLEATGFSKDSLGLPKITYDANASTLDGNLNVQARLVEAFKVSGVNIPIAGDVYARFTDLGEKTTVALKPDNSVEAVSVPGTASLGLDGSVDTSVANIPVDIDPLFEKLGFTGSLKGHVGASRVHVGRLSLAIDGLRSLDILPSPRVSFLTTGFDGDYNRLSIDVSDIDIRPDVVLDFKVISPDPIPDYNRRIGLPAFTGINFHLFDQQLRRSTQIHLGGPFGATLACLEIATRPGPIATGANHIDLYGTNGPQTLSLLDPIPFPVGVEPAIVSLGIDLVTAYVATPFQPGEVTYEPEFGEC